MGWHSAAIGGLVAQAAQWPPIDPLRHGTPICFDGDGHSFEECCNQETFGPWGNPECFEGIFSYELCCLPDWKSRNTEVRACDWVQFAQDYKEQAQNSEDPPGEAEEILSQNDQLYEESCCMTYQAEQNLCWGYLPHLRRRLPGTNLSRGYVSCCYDHLQALLEARRNGAPDPAWLQKEMEAEMPTEYSPVRHQDIGRVQEERTDALLCRLRRAGGTITVHPRRCFRNGRVKAFYLALHILNWYDAVPENLDILLTERDFEVEDYGVPVFTDMRPASVKPGQLIRFPHEFLLGHWGRQMNYRVRSGVMRYPWRSKQEVLFWRGGMTGRWICPPSGDGDCVPLKDHHSNRQWNLTHWHLGVRGRAALLQSFAPPGYVDVKFTSAAGMTEEVQELLTEKGWLDQNEPPSMLEKQFRAKYLLVTDDSDRIYWMATGNSLLFMPGSSMLRGCGLQALEPWTHFVPLKPDLSDALQRIAWAREHDEEARLMAARSAALAREAFRHEAQLFCLARMLEEVSQRLED